MTSWPSSLWPTDPTRSSAPPTFDSARRTTIKHDLGHLTERTGEHLDELHETLRLETNPVQRDRIVHAIKRTKKQLRALDSFAETPRDELHSDLVTVEEGTASFIVHQLMRIKRQTERELARTDLYPNVRDRLFRRMRALQDVIHILGGESITPSPSQHILLIAEHEDESLEIYEADGEIDATQFEDELTREGADVSRHVTLPASRHQHLVHKPITEERNRYRPLPPHLLRQVVHGAGGPQNLRWPDDQPTGLDFHTSSIECAA